MVNTPVGASFLSVRSVAAVERRHAHEHAATLHLPMVEPRAADQLQKLTHVQQMLVQVNTDLTPIHIRWFSKRHQLITFHIKPVLSSEKFTFLRVDLTPLCTNFSQR